MIKVKNVTHTNMDESQEIISRDTQPANKGYILYDSSYRNFQKSENYSDPPHTQNTKATVIFGQKGLPTKGHEGTFWVNGNIQYHDCGERSTTV